MEGDPFKQRYPPKRPKKAVLLASSDLDKIVADSRIHQIVEEEERALRERRESRLRESKELSAALSQRRQPGHELRKRQYALGTKYAKVELDREAKMETRKNKVLEQAYKRLYEETDRVKYFKTAQSSDLAAKGRKDQMATRVSQKNEEERYDVQFLLGTLRDVDQYESEEQEKAVIKQENKKKECGELDKAAQ
ncbi:TPH domain-containing protein [Caerostris extrusa]|uniref:TPH domain-containing protein n=1 Tax=Caerostris extrusa TaxID=172846 RepID=A0AAV4M445_CAEEX|nr:TPH domain-containing protein [Caerostris extrusa]